MLVYTFDDIFGLIALCAFAVCVVIAGCVFVVKSITKKIKNRWKK